MPSRDRIGRFFLDENLSRAYVRPVLIDGTASRPTRLCAAVEGWLGSAR